MFEALSLKPTPTLYEVRRNVKQPDSLGKFCGAVALRKLQQLWEGLPEIENMPDFDNIQEEGKYLRILAREEVHSARAIFSEDKMSKGRRSLYRGLREKRSAFRDEHTIYPWMIDGIVDETANGTTTFSIRFADHCQSETTVDRLTRERNEFGKIMRSRSGQPLLETHEVAMPIARVPETIGKMCMKDEGPFIKDYLREEINTALSLSVNEPGIHGLDAFMVETPTLVPVAPLPEAHSPAVAPLALPAAVLPRHSLMGGEASQLLIEG